MPPPLNLNDLGRRIRAARMARRLTLEEVVSRTDFTVSWLSKVENGLLAPSLEGLVRLAEVLECSVEHLVAGLSVPPRVVVDRRNGGRPAAGRDGRGSMVVERLAETWRERAMEPAILHVSANGQRKAVDHHDGERFLHILDGEVKVAYGDEIILLGPGDSIYLDASLPHRLTPAARTTARVLSVSFQPSRNGHALPRRATEPAASRPGRG
ncbi:MAG: XRE family transcriptional regulator [Planctomycetota bacterium]